MTKKNTPNQIFPGDHICPIKDECPYGCARIPLEDKLKNPDLFCPEEVPHKPSKREGWCTGNKCCPDCVPYPEEDWGKEVPFRF